MTPPVSSPHRARSSTIARSRCLGLAVVVVLAGVWTPPARADRPAPEALDEAEFLARVERTDPRFEVYAARVEATQAEVAAASVRPNPTLAFDREQIWSGGAGFADHFGTLAVPLEISGARSRRIEAARTNVTAARAEVDL